MKVSANDYYEKNLADSTDSLDSCFMKGIPHISVCICTYKRPVFLKRLLIELSRQNTGGLFTYSIVVADNDQAKSAQATIDEMRSICMIPIEYCFEIRQNIALARNKVVENAVGDFLAFIDDDEFPDRDWLMMLFTTCKRYKVDGVLGPVKRQGY